MTRKLIATILAAAIAVTSVNAGTAQAGDRDAMKIIVGATALAIIGSALVAEQNRNRTTPSYQGPRHQPQPPVQDRWQDRPGHDQKWQRRYEEPRPRRISLNRDCLMTVRGQEGWTEGYALRCAQNTTRAELPSDCVRRNYAQGPRMYYSAQCLRRNGFNA